MSLIFYGAPMSTASVTHAVLEELGVPYEKVAIDLKANDQKKAEFLKLNPNGKVPTVVHDGVAIFESAAITIYLGETFGKEKNVWPTGPSRGEAMKWVVWSNVSLGEALSRHQRNTSDRIPKDQHNAKAGEIGKADVESHLQILDGALAGKQYLVGNSFTLCDCHLASWAMYVAMCGFDLAKYPNLSAWAKRCQDRPATKRAL